MDLPKFNIPKFTMPDIKQTFEPPKINEETLKKFNEGINEQHRQADKRYKIEVGLVILGVILTALGTYLTYTGNTSGKENELREIRIFDLEKKMNDLNQTIQEQDKEIIKLRLIIDSSKTAK